MSLTCDEYGALISLQIVNVFCHIILEVGNGSLTDKMVDDVIVQSLQSFQGILEDLTECCPLDFIITA